MRFANLLSRSSQQDPKFSLSARRNRPRSNHKFPFMEVERFEARVVPAALDPGFAVVNHLVQATPIQVHTPGEACADISLTSAGKTYFAAHPGTTLDVGIASYLEFGSYPDLTKQVFLDSKTATLTLDNPSTPQDESTVNLCVVIDRYNCTQADTFAGSVVKNFSNNAGPNGRADTYVSTGRFLSGAIIDDGIQVHPNSQGSDDLHDECEMDKRGNQGLTLGFWKNHYANWEIYKPTDRCGDVFTSLDDHPEYASLANLTLAQALELGGGPGLSDKAGLLVKQGIASLLNGSNDEVHFTYTESQVRLLVDAALDSLNTGVIGTLQGQLDSLNSQEGVQLSNPINNSKK